MKFIYKGTYTQKYGRMFAFGKPLDVLDKATIAKLRADPDFFEFVETVAPVVQPPAPASKRPLLHALRRK